MSDLDLSALRRTAYMHLSGINPTDDPIKLSAAEVLALLSRLERAERIEAAARVALEALERCYDVREWPADGTSSQDAAIAALRAALEQMKGEPT